ncbi:16S rRNA (guanine(527)-N(7))-methyltransferase RsmG [Chloroflexota bacterium]
MTIMEKLKSGAEKLGLHLSPKQLEQFEVYYQELVSWNRRMNLTSITDYDAVQVKHFLDSLTVTLALSTGISNLRLIDVGTGAGLPGIPLKILMPDVHLALLEATAKKAEFLRHIVSRLGLDDVEIVVGRAEEIAHRAQYREKFDVVLSRAVSSLPALVELTLPFGAVGGICVAQKKGDIDLEIVKASEAITVLGGSLREVKKIDLEELADKRRLIIIDKTSPTPEKYPRQPGIPNKRPII